MVIDQTIPLDDSAVMMHLNICLAVFVTLAHLNISPSAASSFSKL